MILLGAGSSVPFGIPAMAKFVALFKEDSHTHDDPKALELLERIESSLRNSEALAGTHITFDLESLLVVLEDLVYANRPISTPTFIFVLYLLNLKEREIGAYNIDDIRRTYGGTSEKLLRSLQEFVFRLCLQPIKIGERKGDFAFLDRFYGPLFALLDNLGSRPENTKWVFTTNWDTCIKQWLGYTNQSLEDGTKLDNQGQPVLDAYTGWSAGSQTRKIVPLHGSLDLIKKSRVVSGGSYEDIHKVTNPEIYFEGNPNEIRKTFMIYPLEAIGFEQSIRSPYIDMLYQLKTILRQENCVFVVGFSLRDPTIASIFEEVLRERAQKGDWRPINENADLPLEKSDNLEELKRMHLKIFAIGSSPQNVRKNLIEHGYTNIGSALIPIRTTFPEMISPSNEPFELSEVSSNLSRSLTAIYDVLCPLGLSQQANHVGNYLAKYGLSVSQR